MLSFKLLILNSFIPADSIPGAKFEAGFDKPSFENSFVKNYKWLIISQSNALNVNFEFCFEKLLQVGLINIVTHLVQNNGSFVLVIREKIGGFHSIEKILVFILGLDVLVVECSTNACF